MKKVLFILGISLLVTTGIITVYHYLFMPKLGFVQTGVVLQKYKGMKEVNKKYNEELKTMRANVDTLKKRYEQMLSNTKTKTEPKKKKNEKLQRIKRRWKSYREKASKQIQNRKQELNKKVFEDMNRIIQAYGDKHNYDLIFGTTKTGSIMYGKEAKDLTNIIIQKMNKQYEKNAE